MLGGLGVRKLAGSSDLDLRISDMFLKRVGELAHACCLLFSELREIELSL